MLIGAGALLPAFLAPAATRAQRDLNDPGGDRIERFGWENSGRGDGDPVRYCTQDRVWCAEYHFPRNGGEGPRELQIIARATNREPRERRWRYVLPDGRAGMIWSEIVRDGWGGALVGIETWQATGTRPSFFSNQRRLILLHIPSVTGGQPRVVLETPLSGFIEQRMCPSPGYPEAPGAAPPPGPARAVELVPVASVRSEEIRLQGILTDEGAAQINACTDRFDYETWFTLLPTRQPMDQPPDLIVATVASTSPGRRPRTPPGTEREPTPRTEDDVVRDPVCTFTRTYYFDAAQRRYVPDAPLPACRDFLEP